MNSEDEFRGPVNLGNPFEFSVKELAIMIIELTGSKSKLSYQPLPSDDPLQRQPNIALAKKHLDWEPKTQLREGLLKTIPFFETITKN
jgi:UDP-glucuronate decarboxylase